MQTIAKHQIKLMYLSLAIVVAHYYCTHISIWTRVFTLIFDKIYKANKLYASITINENVWCNLMVAVKPYIKFHNDISRKIATCCHNDALYIMNVNAKHESRHADAYIYFDVQAAHSFYLLRITFIIYRVEHLSWHLMCVAELTNSAENYLEIVSSIFE